MPTRYGPPPAYRPDPQASRNMLDLIMNQGRVQAEAAERSGAIWGNAIANIGQTLAGGFQAYAAENQRKEAETKLKVRDQAFMNAIGSWDGKDPKKLFSSLSMFRPEDAMKMTESIVAFNSMTGKADEEDAKRFGTALRGAGGLSDAVLKNLYPTLIERGAPILRQRGIDPAALPKEWDPALRGDMTALSSMLTGEKPPVAEDFTLGAGESRFGPDGKLKASVAPKAPEGPTVGSFEDYVTRVANERGLTPQQLSPRDIESARKAYQQADDRPRVTVDLGGGGGGDATALLLQGGTADKLPIKTRSAAVAAARASGGVDGTGFVPMNAQQQNKFSDFMDLRGKAIRLRELLEDKDVADKLGPLVGSAVDATKEWPIFGQSTKVKEAFDLFTDLSDTELRKRSGAAISPNEYDRITGFTVTPSKQSDSNKTNLDRMLDVLGDNLRTIGATNLPGATPRRPVRISNDADYDRLQRGEPFIDPDGKLRVKP